MGTTFRIHLVLLSLLVASALPSQGGADPAVGIWQGTAKTTTFELHLVVHVGPGERGAYRATLDLLDERLHGFPIEDFSSVDGVVKFAVRPLGARFSGTLTRGEPRQIEGHWLPGTGRIPVVFEAVPEVVLPVRPQDPSGPLPYSVFDVAFSHVPARGLDASFRPAASESKDAVTLAGTLSIPEGDAPHAAVVLIAGSGYQNRDATIRGHRLFMVLADHLTRSGFAVLRYDKRGCALSTGILAGATSADFAVDARAALRYLRSRADIDPARLGLLGHSEGGAIAPAVAAGPDAALVRFVVSLAGPGVNGEEAIVHQIRRMTAVEGTPTADLDVLERLERRLFALLRTIDDDTQRRTAMESAAREAWTELSAAAQRDLGNAEDNLVARARRADDPWVRYVAGHEPASDFEQVTCPILVLCGEKDLHIDPAQNLPPIRAALAAGGNPDHTVAELPQLNHLFQTCATGSPSEYYDIEQTMAPAALEVIARWLRERFAAR